MVSQWIKSSSLAAATVLAFVMSGCSSSLDKVTDSNAPTMKKIYSQYTGAGDDTKMAERHTELLKRPALTEPDLQLGLPPYPQRLDHLYPRLPNPDLFMYVRPHAVGVSGAPIPAYITRFSMYERQPYALPGETLDAAKLSNDYQVKTLQEQRAANAKNTKGSAE